MLLTYLRDPASMGTMMQSVIPSGQDLVCSLSPELGEEYKGMRSRGKDLDFLDRPILLTLLSDLGVLHDVTLEAADEEAGAEEAAGTSRSR